MNSNTSRADRKAGPVPHAHAAAWRQRALALAHWAMSRVVVRHDVYGAYRADGGQYTEHADPTIELLERHFSGRGTIGAHSTSPDGLCLCITGDIDAHDDDPGADPDANWKCALAAADFLAGFGLRPMVCDSNGAGGYHVRCFFKKPVPVATVHWLGERLKSALVAAGFKAPEVFPKQAEITLQCPYGNWVRLPGKHHKRDHWTRIWDPKLKDWHEGDAAIDVLLSAGDDVAGLLAAYKADRAAEAAATNGHARANGKVKPKAKAKRGPAAAGPGSDPGVEELRSALAAVPAALADDYDSWLAVGMGLHNWDVNRGLPLWHKFSSQSTKYDAAVLDAKWLTFTQSPRGVTVKLIFKEAYDNGWTGPDPVPAKDRGGDGGGGFILDRSGAPVSCATNCKAWLEGNRPAGHVRLDTFRRAILVGGEPLTDRTIVDLAMEIEASLLVPWAQAHVLAAVTHLAHRDEFSSLALYLGSLEWDGEPRIEQFFPDHFGVDDNEYHREVARVFFLSAAARGLRPGCKVDTVPLLIGPQGVGKSRSVAALCPDPSWFSDQLNGDLGSKDASQGLQGKFIIELAELAAMRKSDLEPIKAFLSREVDHFRPSYGRVSEDFPRTCVFVATTNEDAPLQDLENRRFHPVRVAPHPVDVRAIEAGRDQLWAEAVHRLKSGEEWWTTSATRLDEVREQGWTARAADAWEDILAENFPPVARTTIVEAAQHLKITHDRLGRSEQTRIGNALRAIGFVVKRDPKPPRVRYYERGPSNL